AAWEQRSLMRDATLCSPWLESPVRTILTLLILAQEPTPSLIRKSVWIFKRRQSPLPTSDLWRLLAPAGEAKSSGPAGRSGRCAIRGAARPTGRGTGRSEIRGRRRRLGPQEPSRQEHAGLGRR